MHRLVFRDALELARAHEALGALHRQIGVHRRGTVADQRRDVMHLAHVAGLGDQCDLHARPLPDEVVVHRRDGEQRRYRGEILVAISV